MAVSLALNERAGSNIDSISYGVRRIYYGSNDSTKMQSQVQFYVHVIEQTSCIIIKCGCTFNTYKWVSVHL